MLLPLIWCDWFQTKLQTIWITVVVSSLWTHKNNNKSALKYLFMNSEKCITAIWNLFFSSEFDGLL